MRTNTTTTEREDAVRLFVRRLVDDRFAGNARALALAVKIPQSVVSDVLARKRSLGVVGLEKLADFCGCSVDEVLGRGPVDASFLSQHPQWAEAVAQARSLHTEIQLSFFEDAGRLSIPGGLPQRLDAAFIAGLAGELRNLADRAKVAQDSPTTARSTALSQSGVLSVLKPERPKNVRNT